MVGFVATVYESAVTTSLEAALDLLETYLETLVNTTLIDTADVKVYGDGKYFQAYAVHRTTP